MQQLALAQQLSPITGDVIRTVPEIITAAAKSPLGILALMVVIAGALMIQLLGRANQKLRFAAIVLVVLGVAGYAAAIANEEQPAPSNFSARVLDANSKVPVEKAKVTLDIEGPPPYTMTDSDGVFSFWLRLSENALDGRLRVEHDDYQTYDRTFLAQSTVRLQDVMLKPRAKSVPTDTSTSPPIGNTSPSPTKLAPSKAIQPDPIDHPAVRAIERSSGPKLSGARAGWSDWYTLTLGPAPEGYSVQKAEFWLTGDRQCNAWAECQETQRDDSAVSYRFRLQGHNEWSGPGQAFSEGNLRVTYARK